jgi:hypothetical protein
MSDQAYRDGQWEHRYTGRVAAINRFIDKLGAENEAGRPRTSLRSAEESTHWR